VTTHYSHETRLTICGKCGAPIEAAVAGGSVQCSYCRHVGVVGARDEREDLELARQASASAMSEADRLNVLRRQAGRPLELPASLAPWVAAGRLAPEHVPGAQAEWRRVLPTLAGGAPPHEQERFFHLTRLLGEALGGPHERATFESAVDALSDPRHRHILRCELSIGASREGDATAAEQWLAPCHPAPTDLHMDSAHRLARAYLATAAGDPSRVWWLLGRTAGDVPVVDGRTAEADVLRAHAAEADGDPSAAVERLLASMRADARHVEGIERVVQSSGRLGLCPSSFPAARARIWEEVRVALRPAVSPGLGCVAVPAVALLVGVAVTAAGALQLLVPSSFEANAFFAAMAGLLGVPASALFLVMMLRDRSASARVRNGTLGFAEVRSAEHTHVAARTQAATGSTVDRLALHVVVDVEGRPVAVERFVSASPATPPGRYPCLMDPKDPHTVEIWRGTSGRDGQRA